MIASIRKLYALGDRRERIRLAILFAMMVTAALLEVVGVGSIPAFVGVVVDPDGLRQHAWLPDAVARNLPQETDGLVIWAVALLIGVFAVKNAFLTLYYHMQMRFISDCRANLARRLVNAYMRAPYRFHLERNSSELIRNVESETAIIAHQVLAALLEIATRVLILFAVLVFLLVVEPWITLVWVLLFGGAATVGVFVLSGRLKRFGLQEQHCRQRVLQALAQGFGSIKESRIMGREQFFADVASENVRRMSEAIRVKKFIGAALNPATESIAVAGLLVIAAGLVLSGRSTESALATIALFVVGLVRMRETASAALTHLANVRYNVVAVDPVYDDLTAFERGGGSVARSPVAAEKGMRGTLTQGIELRNVHFRYDSGDGYALSEINLRIPAGKAVGFVGGTGAGKSTLVDLILGLLEPDSGCILVDGKDIHAGNLQSWQRCVGYVPQSIYLLDDTIRNNIALGRQADEVDSDKLTAAIRAAQIEMMIERLPVGLDTLIGEHGARLSGGERQRIGIARALYNSPAVLVLDEATSALDTTTEKSVMEAVESLKGERTVILIAHRLSTVRNCDLLFFLRDGRTVATGTYDELCSLDADFRGMASG